MEQQFSEGLQLGTAPEEQKAKGGKPNLALDVPAANAVKRLSAPTGAKKIHESGMYWDENLDMTTGAVLNINLYDNTVGYYAGQTIAGSIDIEVLRPFKASELTVELVGMERGHLDASGVLAPLDWHREAHETVAIKTQVATFDDNS